MRRTFALLLVIPALVVLPAAPALAATVTVTTTADVVNGGDGLVSLREAVDAANAAAGPTTIELAAGAYTLSLCADDDTNAGGDLDVTTAQPVTVDGGGATVTQTCANERLLHTLDTAGTVIVQDVTLTGGEGPGAAAQYAGDLDVVDSTVSGNDAGGGAVLNSEDGISGASLDLTGSTLGPNTGTGIRVSFGTVHVTDSVIWQHTLRGVGLIDGALTVTGSTVTQNGTGGLSTTGQGSGLFALTDSTVSDNDGTGVTCSACGHLEVTGSTISGNSPGPSSPGGGIVVNADQDTPTDELHVYVTNSTVSGNTREGAGGGLGVFILENTDGPPPAQIVLTGSTFSANGALGANGRGGGVYAETGETRVDNSTLTGNNANVSGGALFGAGGDVFLRHATVYGNFGPAASNVATGADLHAFASVVALGTGGADECAIAGTTTSTGYNVGGDGSCAFVAGPGDLNTTPDAGLLSLATNGGPTQTLLPTAASPVNGRVPAGACTVLTTDQRGTARPQGAACETGAVEVSEVPPAPVCTKTGTPGPDVLIGTPGADVLCGLGGADTLLGLGGDDELRGGDGNDLLIGGAGDDTLRGGAGADLLIGAPGTDVYDGGPGGDLCVRPSGTPFC
ncbi:right-handed parallel beta-helix repeat-containing protein [Catellatospora bangladeshensis]|uniref:Right handed beta helix domain-containing protein n=1 Tax=Catellatospora bangladeshensis TaxID=310355 RepID=A0A8J3JK88_9ACTN|nr:right-handed parallel beta-helix repeat-containing protein [Catellatospora bangladeshensis]GIF82201.1 hypothetical protein Cba03nite_35500 [Catellatospora bangladeshensis]